MEIVKSVKEEQRVFNRSSEMSKRHGEAYVQQISIETMLEATAASQ